MIINIRGTSGSGKSTIIRKIMDEYRGSKLRVKEEGRKQPIGYILHRGTNDPREERTDTDRALAIIGHYETPCGGCDTIQKMENIFAMVRKSHEQNFDVLFEGLLISADFNRTYALHTDGLPLHVFGLDVPLQLCLDSVNERRQTKWKQRCEKADELGKPRPDQPGPVNPKNTESKWKGTRSTMKKLVAHGVDARTVDREQALSQIKELLRLAS